MTQLELDLLRTNRGFEGLAISPDGRYSYAMLQSATLDEGGGSGVYVRIVKFDNTSDATVAQYAYQMEGSSQGRGFSALAALDCLAVYPPGAKQYSSSVFHY